MEILLLTTDWCKSCREAEALWRSVCEELGGDFRALNIEEDARAQILADKLKLNSYPALVADTRVLAVGLPTADKARELIASLLVQSSTRT